MLFVVLMKAFAGTSDERIARRLEWDYPEDGVRPVTEYWLQTTDPTVVAVVEADHIGQIWTTFNEWNDLFEMSVYPAVSAEDGLEMIRQRNNH